MADENKIRIEKRGEYMAVEGDAGNVCAEVVAEKQEKIDLFEEEARRLWMYINDLKSGVRPLCIRFDNPFLSYICNMVTAEFRPLTKEEKEAQFIAIKEMIDNNKKQ